MTSFRAGGEASRPAGGMLLRGAILAAGLAALGGLAGCGAPPPPPPTMVYATATAGPDANAAANGTGNPVQVRVYQLAAKAGFEGAEFYKLYNADAATLGPDLVKKDEFLLTPGAKKQLTITPPDTVHSIGVFAAYRDFQAVIWHVTADIPANKDTTLAITLDRTGVKIAASPGKPPGF